MEKPLRRILTLSTALAFALMAMLMTDSHLFAASAFKMGVVDPQRVLENSRAGKRALGQLKKYAAARQKILDSDEAELKKIEADLKNGTGLPEEQRREQQAKFRQKLQVYQKRAQEFNAELAQKQKDLVDEYMKKIGAATRAIAEKRGLALVVDKGSDSTIKIVIYNKKSIDITDQVVREFNRRYK